MGGGASAADETALEHRLRDWLTNSMLADGYISPQDVESLLVTDDPDDCHGALDAVQHRRPRHHRKAA